MSYFCINVQLSQYDRNKMISLKLAGNCCFEDELIIMNWGCNSCQMILRWQVLCFCGHFQGCIALSVHCGGKK